MKVEEDRGRRERESEDHSSLPHISGANETDRMQKREAYHHCVSLGGVCVCVWLCEGGGCREVA